MTNRQDNNELIERYIYAVVKRLPEKQREDVGNELRSLIDDMTQEGQSIESTLLSLGRPSELADSYRGEPRYLIGPTYIDSYIKVLKIVLPVVLIALTIGKIISGLTDTTTYFPTFFGEWLGSLISASLSAFAWVTIVFILIERNKHRYEQVAFDPADLPTLPKDSERIRRSESIIGIIIVMIGFAVINFSPDVIAVFNFESGTKVTMINLEALAKSFIWFINIALIIGLIREIAKLMVGRHTMALTVSNAILAIINILLIAFVLLHPEFINPNLNAELAAIGMDLDFDAIEMAQRGMRLGVLIMILGYAFETIVGIYKMIKSDVTMTFIRKKKGYHK